MKQHHNTSQHAHREGDLLHGLNQLHEPGLAGGRSLSGSLPERHAHGVCHPDQRDGVKAPLPGRPICLRHGRGSWGGHPAPTKALGFLQQERRR
jgi:hypothetical protein